MHVEAWRERGFDARTCMCMHMHILCMRMSHASGSVLGGARCVEAQLDHLALLLLLHWLLLLLLLLLLPLLLAWLTATVWRGS